MKERRLHCRVSGDMVRHITVRIRAASDGTLLNLSRRGALIALRRPMPPGSWVDMQLSYDAARIVVRALVLRCRVRAIAALDGVTYEAAFRFEEEMPREEGALDGYSLHADSSVGSVISGAELPVTFDRPGSMRTEPSK